METVSYERYKEVLERNTKFVFGLELDCISLGIVHGALRLMLMHPEVQAHYSDDFKRVAGELRERCLNGFRVMGFTDEEVEALDNQEV